MKKQQKATKVEALCRLQTISTIDNIRQAVERSYHPGMDKTELLTIIINAGLNRTPNPDSAVIQMTLAESN